MSWRKHSCPIRFASASSVPIRAMHCPVALRKVHSSAVWALSVEFEQLPPLIRIRCGDSAFSRAISEPSAPEGRRTDGFAAESGAVARQDSVHERVETHG